MLFQESPPDTSAYMVAGYVVAFTVMGIYLLSLLVRWRNARRDLETLQSLQAPERRNLPHGAAHSEKKVTSKK